MSAPSSRIFSLICSAEIKTSTLGLVNSDIILACDVANVFLLHYVRTACGKSLSEKAFSLCKLCDALCLCGEITRKKIHHRGTEVTQRTTEDFFRQTPSDGLPEGFLDQRFERWVVRCHDDDSALRRASDRRL